MNKFALPLLFFVAANLALAADLPTDIGPNLALGKTYVSSDLNKHGWDGGLTDGVWDPVKAHTYASGSEAKFPKTVTIDLKEKQTIAFVNVGVPNIGSTKTIEVSVSADGKKFKSVGKHDFKMEVENSHLYEFKPASARYVRLAFLENYERTSTATRPYSKNHGFVSEVEVFGPRGSGKTDRGTKTAPAAASTTGGTAVTEIPSDIGANLALGKPYVSSDINKSGWDFGLTDGVWNSEKDNTYASGADKNFPKTIVIDLQKNQTVAFVNIGVPKIGSTKTIEVAISTDGKQFKSVGKHDFKMEVANSHLYAFTPAEARYVRLAFLGNHERRSTATHPYAVEYCFVSEVEVFGPRGSGKTQRGETDATKVAERKIARDQAAARTTRLPRNLGMNLALSKPYKCSDPNKSGWDGGLTDGFWMMRKGHTFATGTSGKFPKHVTIDLKMSAFITDVHFGVPNYGSTKTVAVSVSYDGVEFTEVGKHTFTQGKAESHLISFAPVLARHVRLTYLENYTEKRNFNPNHGFTTEVEVYARPQ